MLCKLAMSAAKRVWPSAGAALSQHGRRAPNARVPHSQASASLQISTPEMGKKSTGDSHP